MEYVAVRRGVGVVGLLCLAALVWRWRHSTGRERTQLAWLLWGAAHIFFLIGFRNRMVVTIDWLWSYLRFGGGARLITGIKPE